MLSVVIPCYNESSVLPLLAQRLRAALDGLSEPYEVILVDDGSSDGSALVLADLAGTWPQVKVRSLARNVGHQLALTAGLDLATGDYVVTMDADLQDPPELIPEMLRRARADGVDVVYAQRSDRTADTVFKRLTARLYYRLMRRVSGIDVPPGVGDFRLLSRRVVVALRGLPERHRVYRLLIPWLGFPSAVVTHRRDKRAAGTTKYSLRRMTLLAMNSVTSFTTTPLRLATGLGLVTAAFAVLMSGYVVVQHVAGHTVTGWSSMVLAMLFLGAVQLICLGVVGEYVGRIFEEVQRRPHYQIDRDLDGSSTATHAPAPRSHVG